MDGCFGIDKNIPKISENLGRFKEENSEIKGLTLDKEEIIIGITNQENIDIAKTATIKVTTEGIEKNQYRWNIIDKNIATIDSKGNITANSSGETMIECKSIDGKKTYATCKLTVEEREYLYYHGTSLVNFDEPLCGIRGTLSGSPYFMDENIYCKFSNENYPNLENIVNFLTKDKIDFSNYKGIGIKEEIKIDGLGGTHFITLPQTKTCNTYGAIDFDEATGYTCYSNDLSLRTDGSEYASVENYNDEAYLNNVVYVGQYQSGVVSTADIYIYEIFLVK